MKKNSSIKWLAVFSRPYRREYIFSVCMAVLGAVCSVVPYLVMGYLITGLLRGEREFSFYALGAAVILGIWILRYVFHGISTSYSHKATFNVLAEIRERIADKLVRVPMGAVQDLPSGEVKSRMVEKVDAIEGTLAHIVPEMSSSLLVSLLTVVYFFTVDWRMALSALVTLPVSLVCYSLMMKNYSEMYGNYVQKNRVLNAAAVEYIQGIEVIKSFNQSAGSYSKFQVAAKEAAASAVNWMRSCNGAISFLSALMPAVLIGVLPVGGFLLQSGAIELDIFVMAVILSLGIMGPLMHAVGFMDELAKVDTTVSSVADILELEDMEHAADINGDIQDISVEMEHVNFRYKETEVLHDVSLRFRPGTVNALVGPSGSGKSTITKLILSMWPVSGGSIRIAGQELRDLPVHQLNAMMSYVSQNNFLFNESIMENIRKGRPGASDEAVMEAARRSGCDGFIRTLENGYQTVVGSGGGRLSGGERQRVTIARAMLKDAPIVILDEATSYTDPENEAVIQKAVGEMVRGKLLIVIAHRLSTVVDADQMILVNDGRIEATGTHEQLQGTSALYRRMWKAYEEASDSDTDAEVKP